MIFLLIVKLFSMTVHISQLESRQRELIQKMALEKRFKEEEEEMKDGDERRTAGTVFGAGAVIWKKKGIFLGHKWAAGPLALLFFLLWHSLDLKASVTETGNTWLFGWYAGLGALVLAAAVFLGDELFIRRKMTLEALFAVSVLCLGGIYSLVLPPLSAPDEVSHYISAYECSNRLMGLPSVNEKGADPDPAGGRLA